jgi:hypothetical protein
MPFSFLGSMRIHYYSLLCFGARRKLCSFTENRLRSARLRAYGSSSFTKGFHHSLQHASYFKPHLFPMSSPFSSSISQSTSSVYTVTTDVWASCIFTMDDLKSLRFYSQPGIWNSFTAVTVPAVNIHLIFHLFAPSIYSIFSHNIYSNHNLRHHDLYTYSPTVLTESHLQYTIFLLS